MSLTAIIDGFETVVRTIPHGGDYNFEDTPYTPTAGRGYLDCQLTAYERSPMALDAKTPNEERGIYLIAIKRPASEGPKLARMMADRVTAAFPRALAISLANSQVVTVEIATAQPSVPSGEWIVIPVTIQWFTTEPPS